MGLPFLAHVTLYKFPIRLVNEVRMKKIQDHFNADKLTREVSRSGVEWGVDDGVRIEIKRAELTDLFRVVCALPKADARTFCKVVARRPMARSGLTLTTLTREFTC